MMNVRFIKETVTESIRIILPGRFKETSLLILKFLSIFVPLSYGSYLCAVLINQDMMNKGFTLIVIMVFWVLSSLSKLAFYIRIWRSIIAGEKLYQDYYSSLFSSQTTKLFFFLCVPCHRYAIGHNYAYDLFTIYL